VANLVRTEAYQLGLLENAMRVMQPKNQENYSAAYVPLVKRARKELGLTFAVGLSDSVKKTIRYHLELRGY